MKKVAVLGAGRFGFALANRFARGGISTLLWGRSSVLNPQGVSEKFAFCPPPTNLVVVTGGALPDLQPLDLDAIFVATGSSGVEEIVSSITEQALGEVPVLFTQKGLVNGISPVRFASQAGLCAGSFTGAAFARDIFAGSDAKMVVASDENWICDVVMDLCRNLKLWVAACGYPEDVCAANVARTIASIEMGVVAGYAEYLVKYECEMLGRTSGDFSPTEIAAATSGIQDEWETLCQMISPGFADRILHDKELDKVRGVLRADNYLCSGLIRDPRAQQLADWDSKTGIHSAKSLSRNWRFGYELGRRQDVGLAEQALGSDGVVQGYSNALELFDRFPECPPFLTAIGLVLNGISTVKKEVQAIRDRRDAWYATAPI